MIDAEMLLKDHQLFHSQFQQDRFITIKNGKTPYGCYRQALRELHKRKNSIDDARLDEAEVLVDIDEAEENFKSGNGSAFDRRRQEIKLVRLKKRLENIRHSIAEMQREFDRFHEQASGLKDSVGHLTDERREQLEAEFWEQQIRSSLAVEILVYGKPGTSTLELLQCVPPDMRQRLVSCIETEGAVKKLTSEYLSEDLPKIGTP